MTIDNPLVTCNDHSGTESSELIGFFSLQDKADFWSTAPLLYNDCLEKLVFRISRKPKSLITHIQRIYYCFQMHLDDQLFAALVDFLFILNKQGQEISWRMVTGAKSRLSPSQFNVLKDYLSDDDADAKLLPGNQFAIFTQGLIGTNTIIQQVSTTDEVSHDPLLIARDHIEFSQLEEAKQVLEKAILEHPARLDCHHELLDIFKCTRDTTGFKQMLAELTQAGVALPDGWGQLNDYFKGQNNDG